MKRVLITGADGFTGKSLCSFLAGTGVVVRAAVRGKSMDAPPAGAESAVPVGDIGPETDWSNALEGVDAVVHLAARNHVLREKEPDPGAEFRRINLQGTIRLAESAAAAGVGRLVFLSTLHVLGHQSGANPFGPGDPPAPPNPYAQSKWEAERSLMRIAADTGMEAVIIRPPLVYGPGVKANFLRLLNLVHRGFPLPLAGVKNRRSFVGISNLTGFVETCLFHPSAAGGTFHVSDGEDISTPELIGRLALLMSRSSRLVHLPPSLLGAAAGLAGRGHAWRQLTGTLTTDIGKSRQMLSWNPPCSLEDGLKDTVRWFLQIKASGIRNTE